MMVYQACHIMIRIMRHRLINVIFKDCAVRKAWACARKHKIGGTYTSPVPWHVIQHFGTILVYCAWLLRPAICRKAHTQVCRTHKSH